MDERSGCDFCQCKKIEASMKIHCDQICQNCGPENNSVMLSNQQSCMLWEGGGQTLKSKDYTTGMSRIYDNVLKGRNKIGGVNVSFKLDWTRSAFPPLLLTLFMVLSLSVSLLDAQCSPTTDCHAPPLDLATKTIVDSNSFRTLEVSSTCGPTTEYRKSSLTFNDTDFFCWANNNSHPAINMLDRTSVPFENFQSINPQLQSYWQSDNTIVIAGATPTAQSVSYNMTDNFLIRYIRVIFLSPHIFRENDNSDMRPRAMVFEKYNASTNAWEALRYYAANCTISFPGVPKQNVDGTGPSYEAQVAVCMEKYYGLDTKTYSGWGFGRQEVSLLVYFMDGNHF